MDLKPGDEVRVFYCDKRRQQPEDGYAVPVVKVGRTLVTLRWRGRDEQFRLDSGRLNDKYGNTAYFMTAVQIEAERRKGASLRLLKEAGWEPRLGCTPDADLTVQLAVVVLRWAAGQASQAGSAEDREFEARSGVQLEQFRPFTLEQIEALAGVVKTWDREG